jgi:hypothetical protein
LEQDELHLLEEAELGDSEFTMGEELVQGRRDRRHRRSAAAVELKKKRISSSEVSRIMDGRTGG